MEENNNQSKGKVIGIDASNLLRGGGVTHLVELLSATKPEIHNINKVVIWANENTLDLINDQPWLIKATPKEINSGFIHRLYWQKYKLSKAAEEAGCDLILAPGGSFFCKFKPIVTMSRNMLPFEWTEAKRYGFSWVTLRLMMLRYLQLKSFRNASGVIFLTKYAENRIIKLTGNLLGITTIIPHGLNPRFQIKPKEQKNISKYNFDKPFRIIYVSIIDQYKHQWNVVEAVAKLRNRGYPVCLSLVGPSYPPSLNRLKKTIDKFDLTNDWVTYTGAVEYRDLHNLYSDSNLAIFASSCENMPNILLEKMASGLPIASSNKGPMLEVLGDSGLYFDPEKSIEIFNVLETLINNPQLRKEKANSSFNEVQKYTWSRCAQETFSFLDNVIIENKKSLCVE